MNPIKSFQLKNSLVPDGIIGTNTLNKMLVKFGLDKNQLSNFLGQCHHETQGFTTVSENLCYSKDRLLEIFPKYFNVESASKNEYKSVDIGNIVYANRMGNGDIESGDGYNFRGRGGLQTSGRNNYSKFSDYIGLDCIKNPDYLSNLLFFESALFYFKDKSILQNSEFVDNDHIYKITKLINGGLNGFNDRVKSTMYYYNLCRKI